MTRTAKIPAKQPPKGDVEKMAGVTGRFIVYYLRDGKPFWDAVYSPTAEQARNDFLYMADELGWNVVIEAIKVREPS